jgi:hypothetical protein
MRTRAEKRAYWNAIDQGVRVRGNRLPKRLPDAWDDFPVNKPQRSWKRHRRTRWKRL